MSDVDLARYVRDIPDFPKPGIVFKDITPLIGDPLTFSTAIDEIVVGLGRGTVDKVVGIEARGFIIAAPVASTSSTIATRSPGTSASRWISMFSSPYSSAYDRC